MYRDALGPVRIVLLDVPEAGARERVERRSGHYMPASLVASQYEALERLPYTKSTVLEGLRLFAPATLVKRQALCDAEVDGFMVPKGWDIVSDYYIRQKTGDWVPYSKQLGGLALASNVRSTAEQPFGKVAFAATFVGADGVSPISPWHDLPLYPAGAAASGTTARRSDMSDGRKIVAAAPSNFRFAFMRW